MLAAFGLGEREQAVEDAAQPVGLLDREPVLVGAGRVGDEPAELLHPQPQCRQRVAQLVAGLRDEGPLPFQGIGHVVGHRVERAGQPAQLGRAQAGRHPRVERAGTDLVRGRVELGDRAQDPPGQRDRNEDEGESGQDAAAGKLGPPVFHGGT